MAIYHLSVKIISRSQGRSAVAAAAYRAAEKMENEYDGIVHDFRKKGWVAQREILVPEHAPLEYSDRCMLWNAVEKSEKRKTAQLAREIEIALPRELSLPQQIELLRQYIEDKFVAEGMCADYVIHNPPLRDDKNRPVDYAGNLLKDKKDFIFPNPHAHIMLTMRPIDENGKWEAKSATEYVCIRDGIEVGMTAEEFKSGKEDGWQKQYQYQEGKKKIWLTDEEGRRRNLTRISKTPKQSKFGRQNPTVERWNSPERVFEWRDSWASYCNRYLREAKIDASIDARSFAEQGREELPTVHLGVEANAMDKRADRMERVGKSGTRSEAGQINREIRRYNELIRKLQELTGQFTKLIQEKLSTLRAALIGVEYQLMTAKTKLSEGTRERYHRLEAYIKADSSYHEKIANLELEKEEIVQAAQKIRIWELGKRKELQDRQEENKKAVELVTRLRAQLPEQYGLDGAHEKLKKEFIKLEYVTRYEQLEKDARHKKSMLLGQYQREWQEAKTDLDDMRITEPSLSEKKVKEILNQEYLQEFDEFRYQSVVETVDKKINIIQEKAANEHRKIILKE